MHVADNVVQDILHRSENLDHALFAVGIEILPFELIGVIIGSDGAKLGTRRRILAHMDVDYIVDNISELAGYLTTTSVGLDLPSPRVTLGLQVGGPVDTATGVVRFYSNHPTDRSIRLRDEVYEWDKDVPLARLVEDATGCPTFVENDAHAFATYEQKLGIGRSTSSFALILIRDGIGGGVVIDNRLLSVPMEIGHSQVVPDGRVCDCGNNGCLDSYASPRAIRAIVGERTKTESVQSLDRAIALANSNHEILAVFEEAGKSVALGAATILTLFGPSHLVIYGPDQLIGAAPESTAVNHFMQQLNQFREYAYPVVRKCDLVLETLSGRLDRGAHGAGLIALNRQFLVSL